MTQRRIGHRRFQHRIVNAVELKREKQKVRRRGSETLLHVAIKLGASGIDGIAGMDQPGIGASRPIRSSIAS